MIPQNVKYGDIENTKCEIRGLFYKLVIKVGYFFRKIIKRSPEFAILVKKYEIGDFGGSFDKSSVFFPLTDEYTAPPLSISPNILERWRKWKVFKFSKLFF